MPLDFSLEEFAVGVHVDVAGFAEFEDEQHEGDEAGEDEGGGRAACYEGFELVQGLAGDDFV
jgi:hypothetical protein